MLALKNLGIILFLSKIYYNFCQISDTVCLMLLKFSKIVFNIVRVGTFEIKKWQNISGNFELLC